MKKIFFIIGVVLFGVTVGTTEVSANCFSNGCESSCYSSCGHKYKFVKKFRYVTKYRWVKKRERTNCGYRVIKVKKCYRARETYYKRVRISCR